MGQYHLAINLDKKQYLNPHELGDGLKLWEQAASGHGGVGSALIVLLGVSNGRGGGDFETSELVGSWGGDRIAIVGDYAEDTDLPAEFEASDLYRRCRDGDPSFRNITADVAALLERELQITYSGNGWRDRTTAVEA